MLEYNIDNSEKKSLKIGSLLYNWMDLLQLGKILNVLYILLTKKSKLLF